jgi:hypothetical protein
MMSNAEAHRWSKSHVRGFARFLLHQTLVYGFLPFASMALILWFGGFNRMGLSREFLPRMLRFSFLLIVGGALFFGVLWWIVEEQRYRHRMAAEARGELPRSIGA